MLLATVGGAGLYDPRPMAQSGDTKGHGLREYVQRTLIAVGLTSAVVLTGFLVWSAAGALLLIFSGVLFGVFLHTLAAALGRAIRLPRAGLALAVLALAALLGGVGLLLAPRIAAQVDQLATGLPQAVGRLEGWLSRYRWGEQLIERTPFVDGVSLPTFDAVSRLTGTFSTLFNLLTNAVFVLFIGLFTAADPGGYRDGLVGLVPPGARARAREVLSQVWRALRGWLLSKLLAMVLVGLLTGVGLAVLGMPFALTLGLLAGLFELIPFVGPVLAAVPALLVALTQSPWQILYVALLFLIVQQLEGNFITPLVYKRTVALPPVLTLAAVLVMGTLFGLLGLFVATPLLAAALVLVRTLYQQDMLGDPPTDRGS